MTGRDLEPIPAGALPLVARAPAKCIVFGEHAVVHGEPELLLAIDLATQVGARAARSYSLNADPEPTAGNPYLAAAIARTPPPGGPFGLRVSSRIPRSAGLGSSAAFVAALAAILGALRGGIGREELAREAFAIERGAQGVGSPGDTSASVAGGYLTVNHASGPRLWEVHDAEHRWTVRRVPDPGWGWVVGYTGIPRSTGEAVRAVGRRLAEADGGELLERFREIAASGIDAVAREERTEVGRLLDRNHELLREVGVSHPRLEALREAVRPVAEGAKLTGAGAGGSILVLPHPGREMEAVRRIARAGGVAFAVRAEPRGAGLVGAAPPEPPP
jgi:mevalonate kinase